MDSRGAHIFPSDARFSGNGFEGGFTVSDVVALRPAGRAGAPGAAVRLVPLETTVSGTLMRVDLDQPLPPRTRLEFALDFGFAVPEPGADRMGRERFGDLWLYELAQWYPRLAVYDDVRGWNTEPYLGQGEFYLEYRDFDYAITVPRSFIVAETGDAGEPRRSADAGAGPAARPRPAELLPKHVSEAIQYRSLDQRGLA